MDTLESLNADLKKYMRQTSQNKLDLHDLAEDLPVGWEKIPEMAAKTFESYKKLDETRKKIAALGG